MARAERGQRLWGFPALGFVTALLLALVPGQPFALEDWPASGPFGAFTWGAFLVASVLAWTVAWLALAVAWRVVAGGCSGLRPTLRRLLGALAFFGLLAGSAFGAATRADLLAGHPVPALGLALAAVVALGAWTRRFHAAVQEPSKDRNAEVPPVPPRTRILLAFGAAYALVWLTNASGLLGWVVGPSPGDELTVGRPAPLFRGEEPFFEYLTRREAGGPAPTPDQPGAAVLARGARVEVKGFVEGGLEVRVAHDPAGRLQGEWGYVRPGDLAK